MCYVTLESTCSEGADTKTISANFLIVDILSPYNIILGHPVINALEENVSTWYLTLKCLLLYGIVETVKVDQQVAHDCYLSSLETAKEELALVDAHPSEVPNTGFEGWDPNLGTVPKWLTPMEDLKEVQIGPHTHQVTNIWTSLSVGEKRELVDRLRRNVELFS